MYFSDLDFIKLLPHWMQDDDFDAALANAITEILEPATSRYKTLRIWDQLENLTSTELDELAYELSIDWWDSSWELDTKVNVIKTAQQIMSKRGTKWAVEQLGISTLGSCEVQEWFDYDGEVFHFKVETYESLTDEAMEKFIAMIDKIKPVRAVLDSVDGKSKIETNLYLGAFNTSYIKNSVVAEVQ